MRNRLTYTDAAGAHDTYAESDADHYPHPDPTELVPAERGWEDGPVADAFRAAVAGVRRERGEP